VGVQAPPAYAALMVAASENAAAAEPALTVRRTISAASKPIQPFFIFIFDLCEILLMKRQSPRRFCGEQRKTRWPS
jgi:hypothetical protein